jgi:hypothetical protein
MSYINTYSRNGKQYAEVRTSERIEGILTPRGNPTYLGRVIDLDKGLFHNKKMGVYKYTIQSGAEITDLQDKDALSLALHKDEKMILDFGSSFLLAEFSKKAGFFDLFRNTLPLYDNSLMALLFYYLEVNKSNSDAADWLEGSFSRLMFPIAQLESQRISELLARLGDEAIVRNFFKRYLSSQFSGNKKFATLIDSTGLPNAIHFPLTATSNHNGDVNEEIRLIFVVDTVTGLPLYFRYNAGNVVDITTLIATLDELEQNGVTVENAVIDAGYCSDKNIKSMYDHKVDFLTRVPVNRNLYKNALTQYKDEVLSNQCRYIYQKRAIGIKRIYTTLFGHRGYIYLCVDYNSRNDKITKFTEDAIDDKIPRNKWDSYTDKMGFFALLSSKKIEPNNLLPLYYTRQRVEQIFDVTKNNLHILPLRTHNEDTFRGHIMMTFMSTILFLSLNKLFKDHKKFTADNAISKMKNLKCKVFDNCILVKEINKDMREICDIVGIKVPEKIILPLPNL